MNRTPAPPRRGYISFDPSDESHSRSYDEERPLGLKDT
jgi:hypothetical protein